MRQIFAFTERTFVPNLLYLNGEIQNFALTNFNNGQPTLVAMGTHTEIPNHAERVNTLCKAILGRVMEPHHKEPARIIANETTLLVLRAIMEMCLEGGIINFRRLPVEWYSLQTVLNTLGYAMPERFGVLVFSETNPSINIAMAYATLLKNARENSPGIKPLKLVETRHPLQ